MMLLSVRLRPSGAGSAAHGQMSPGGDGAGVGDSPTQGATPGAHADASWREQAVHALALLSVRTGFVRGWLARSPDNSDIWLLSAEFESAGACRRALSAADVRPVLWPLLADASDGETTFEVLAAVAANRTVKRLVSDLAPDSAEVRLGHMPEPPDGSQSSQT